MGFVSRKTNYLELSFIGLCDLCKCPTASNKVQADKSFDFL